jgi:hypothetical protein
VRPLDLLRNAFRADRELRELHDLWARLLPYADYAKEARHKLCLRVVQQALSLRPGEVPTPLLEAALGLCQALLAEEGLLYVPEISLREPLSTAEVWELTGLARRHLAPFEEPQILQRIAETLKRLLQCLLAGQPATPPAGEEETPAFAVPLHELIPDSAAAVEAVLALVLGEGERGSLFPRLRSRLERNLLNVSGIDPAREGASRRQVIPPTKARDKTSAYIVAAYLADTPLAGFLETLLPFSMPLAARFEHTHILGGSGHGKTQLLQGLLLHDLKRLSQGQGSVVVIDSQGDMIRTLLGLAELSPLRKGGLSERLVLIDPNDIEHPPCLNLFDFGLERLNRYGAVEREKLTNGAIALYEYMFGALLGAELTQRQGLIFRYLARLLMVVPGATIHTLREFMETPEATRGHLNKLDPTSRLFFETQFFSKAFDDTRQQILTRLWGVLSNAVLARMFSHARNKLDLFEALNRGSLILINTAKDLLKQEGCEILGRFFIALIAQAAQERASIPAEKRRATFVYVDEAQDYFDESLGQLLNQARKYKVGLVLAHQNLGQFEPKLQAAVMASTAIKVAGGVSAKDAGTLAKEMRCEPELLQGMRKRERYSEFACFIRNVTARPVRLCVPFGQMESRPRLSEAELEALLERNRARYGATEDDEAAAGSRPRGQPASGFQLGEQEVL